MMLITSAATKIFTALLAVLIMAEQTVCAEQGVQISSVNRPYAEARIAFSKGDLETCKSKLAGTLSKKSKMKSIVFEESAKLLGVCYFLTGNKPMAQQAFKSALESNPQSELRKEELLDPSLSSFFDRLRNTNKVQIQKPGVISKEKNTLAAKPLLTGITVKTNAERATIFDDGIFIGPTGQFIELDPGNHKLTITAEGFLETRKNITLKKAQVMNIQITLKEPQKHEPSKPKQPSKPTIAVKKNAQGAASGNAVDYEGALPAPKNGAALSDEFKPPATSPQGKTKTQGSAGKNARKMQLPPTKTASELLAPPVLAPTPIPYAAQSAQPPVFQQIQPTYVAPQQYAQQPVLAPQPSLFQQQPIIMQPMLMPQPYMQPYIQPYTQPYSMPPQQQYAPMQPQPLQQYQQPVPTPAQQQTIKKENNEKKLKKNSTRLTESIHPALAFLPLGVGQFAKGEAVKGVVFAGFQAGGIGWAVWSYLKESEFTSAEQKALANDDPAVSSTLEDNYDPDQAKAYKSGQRLNQYIGYGIAGAAWGISIIDALWEKNTPRKRHARNDNMGNNDVDLATKEESSTITWGLFGYGKTLGLNLHVEF